MKIDSKDFDHQGFHHPSDECDIVMKGGITSGIVYPPVILKLAERYRFRGIGGTSAGAIAAAITAAAEYGREHDGFQKLEETSEALKEEDFLFHLFQPKPELKPLMDVLLKILQSSKKTNSDKKTKFPPLILGKIGKWLFLPSLLFLRISWTGIFLSLIPIVFLAFVSFSIITICANNKSLDIWNFTLPFLAIAIPLFFLSLLGYLAGSAYGIFTIVNKNLPNNYFGICSGSYYDECRPRDPVLTDWLCERIDNIAGLKKIEGPLTFGHLSCKGLSRKKCDDIFVQGAVLKTGEQVIDLKMITTSLSYNRPYTLPFEDHSFLFYEDEFRELFPAYVVEHLITHAYQNLEIQLPPKYHFLPDGKDLPVIVATRMSLSFPILLSAVPLWTICSSAFKGKAKSENNPLKLEKTQLQKNWFSDGGICSNFPLHFFDSWLPSRPTFGINLLPAKALSDIEDTKLPKVNDQAEPDWIDVKQNLLTFLSQTFSTAQNYRETLQSKLPGYQERIVQIRLTEEQGGLNLRMEPSVIGEMMEKGEQAGNRLRNDFDFPQHQWYRLRLLLGLLEDNLEEIETKVLNPKKLDYNQLLDDQAKPGSESYPYRYPSDPGGATNADYVKKAKDCIERMRASAKEVWKVQPPSHPSLSYRLPPRTRKPRLQITPRF